MGMRSVAAGAAIAMAASGADAAVLWTFAEFGDDVVGSFSGSIEFDPSEEAGLVEITGFGDGLLDAGLQAAFTLPGTADSTDSVRLTGSDSFFATGFSLFDDATGDIFGIIAAIELLLLPNGYVSGDALSGTQIFEDESFASLGFIEGTYTYTTAMDALTVQVQMAAVPLPATLPLMLVALGGAGLGARRRRTA